MKRFVLALVAVGCGGDVDGNGTTYMDAASADEPAGLMGTTAAHNMVRAAVSTSTPLPPMKWDPALATHAMAWASQCKDDDGNGLVDHSSSQYRSNAVGYSYIGESIFAASGNASGTQAVMSWASEKTNFTYPNSCAGVCGHYTQIVWRTSVNLGCALVTCSGLQYKSAVLCMYGPGGNSGGAPY